MLFRVLFFLNVQNMLFRINRHTLIEDAQEFFQLITTFLRQMWNLNHIAVMGEAFNETLLDRQQRAGHQVLVRAIDTDDGSIGSIERMPQEVDADNRYPDFSFMVVDGDEFRIVFGALTVRYFSCIE